MKITLPIAGLLLGVWLLPATGFAADTSTSAVPAQGKETGGDILPNRSSGVGEPIRRSDHPIDDATITTKVKGKFLNDKQIRGDNLEIKTVNGVVELGGVAKNRANSKRAATLARQVAGVKSVKNGIEIAPRDTAAAADRSTDKPARTADGRRSDQPVKDSWITTKVKAKLSENKINPAKVHVKTIDGVVELSGFAGNADQASKAASLAGEIKGVKSVTNHIEVK